MNDTLRAAQKPHRRVPAQRLDAVRGAHHKQSDWQASSQEVLKGCDECGYFWRKRRDDVAEDEETAFLERAAGASDLICGEFVQGPAGGDDGVTADLHDLVAGSRAQTLRQS